MAVAVLPVLLREATSLLASSAFLDTTIRGVWDFELTYVPEPTERVFHYRVLSLMIQAQGTCYLQPDDPMEVPVDLIGSSIQDRLPSLPIPLQVAALDAFFGDVDAGLTASAHTITGGPTAKARQRTGYLVDAIETVVGKPRARIVNIGVVGSLIHRLVSRGHIVHATDLDPALVGVAFADVRVQPPHHNDDLIADADIVVVTGMTLANSTLDRILDVAREHKTRVLLFAETGAHLAPHLCALGFIDAAYSEPFPFYIFQGTTEVRFYERTDL